jgi:hypothetical protein
MKIFVFITLVVVAVISNLLILSEKIPCDEKNGVCIAEEIVAVPKGANTDGKPREAHPEACVDRHEECVEFTANDECNKNPG